MAGSWILRGNKTDRIVGAALLDGALGAALAWSKGEDPVIHGIARALGGADAMAQHRLVKRSQAHARNEKVADLVAQTLERLKDAAARPTQTVLPPSSTPAADRRPSGT